MQTTVQPGTTLQGVIQLPPDKSIAHRTALFASISDEQSIISNFSPAADPQSTLSCLRQLGVLIEQKGGVVTIEGVGRDGYRKPKLPVDCGNSGTTMRLLAGILAGAGVEATLVGDASLSKRPMRRITTPLALMNAMIETQEGGLPPLKVVSGHKISPISYELPVASAQVKSCVLLAGLFTDDETTVIEPVMTRDHTERLLGLKVEEENDVRWITSSSMVQIPSQTMTIPGDFSAASFWLVGASIASNSQILMPNVGLNPTRTACLHILKRMGASIELQDVGTVGSREPVGKLIAQNSDLSGVMIESHEIPNCIDELPILSVAMACANGVSEFRNAEELRFKECDRIDAIARMLSIANVRFEEHQDGLTIYGNPNHSFEGGTFESFHDHRIAMASAILSLRSTKPCTILDAEAAKISYPSFWDDLKRVLG